MGAAKKQTVPPAEAWDPAEFESDLALVHRLNGRFTAMVFIGIQDISDHREDLVVQYGFDNEEALLRLEELVGNVFCDDDESITCDG